MKNLFEIEKYLKKIKIIEIMFRRRKKFLLLKFITMEFLPAIVEGYLYFI